jgi:hypothetical protein
MTPFPGLDSVRTNRASPTYVALATTNSKRIERDAASLTQLYNSINPGERKNYVGIVKRNATKFNKDIN